MFGYVKLYPPELKIREYECYRGIYCGLCKTMGKCTGCISRCFLSYDITFLTVVRMALNNEVIKLNKERCIRHPIIKHSVAEMTESMKYGSSVSALLSHYNVIDDISDKKFPLSLPALMISPITKAAKKRADKTECSAYIENIIVDGLKKITELENKSDVVPDEIADCFGRLLSGIFSYGLNDIKSKRIAENIGFHTGRWIYLIDAVDDYKKDVKSNSFNPFVKDGFHDKDSVTVALKNELISMKTAVDLIEADSTELQAIIENAVLLGMSDITDKISNAAFGDDKTSTLKGKNK